ncbi:MAG: thioredoxin fold domain-containing protein [Gammaproteobacteria bacterium]|nr:thioredoxin fold domain-containing protein [Gammaproteobacteria bacterium]
MLINQTTMFKTRTTFLLLLLLLSPTVYPAVDAVIDNTDNILVFDDAQLDEELVYPDWFKLSFGDLNDDLHDAKAAGKKGIITYFGQKRCAYCEQFFKTSLSDTDTKNYLLKHFDIIAFDIWGIDDIIDTDDKEYSERELSVHYKTNFTPSLVFYDINGTPVFRLRGFYPPYQFRAALQYVAEAFYKKETFAEYLERANPGEHFILAGLTERDFFMAPPYDLTTTEKNGRPIAVFFEQGNCHTCDLLHSGPLNKERIIHKLEKMNVIQLNMWTDTIVTTPRGIKTTAKNWAKKLKIFYTPSIIFFDSDGSEIIRIDSVTHFYRILSVLDYVNKQGYKQNKGYQQWRLEQREISR